MPVFTELFNPVVLIDADSIYYRAAMSVTKDATKFESIHKRKMRNIMRSTLTYINQKTSGMKTMVAVKGLPATPNFRTWVSKDYKAKRKKPDEVVREALAYGWWWFREHQRGITADGMEADDLVCIWANELDAVEVQYIIAHIDKDLDQIPGWHFNFFKDEDPYWVDEDTANYKLMHQCLTGDTSDNIAGLKGIGPKRADKILSGVPMQRRWNRVRAAYRQHKATHLETTYRLLKMIDDWKEYEELYQKGKEQKAQKRSDR